MLDEGPVAPDTGIYRFGRFRVSADFTRQGVKIERLFQLEGLRIETFRY